MNDDPLRRLGREERLALCHEVMERLSDLVEGQAPSDFCERVDALFADCQPYHAYRATLAATIELARECGRLGPADDALDAAALQRCADTVRRRLE